MFQLDFLIICLSFLQKTKRNTIKIQCMVVKNVSIVIKDFQLVQNSKGILNLFMRRESPIFAINVESVLGAKYLFFLSSRFVKMREKYISLLSLYIFEESVFTFQFLNDKIHNYVKKNHNCEFLSFKNWKVNTLPSKNIQTEQN